MAQVAAILLQACCLAVIKPISGCVRIAYFALYNGDKSAASCQQACFKLIVKTFYPQAVDAGCFNNLQQVCKYQVVSSLIFTDLMQLDESNRLENSTKKCFLVWSH